MDHIPDETTYRFSDGVLAPDFIIDDIYLNPLSLGHLTILERIGSPFVNSGTTGIDMDAMAKHYLIALVVCAQTFEDNIKMFDNDTVFQETCGAVRERIKKVMEEDPKWNLIQRITWLRTHYMAFFLNSMPDFHENYDTPAPSGTDWKTSAFCILKREYGYNESTVMNMSLRRLFYEWCSYAEGQGSISIRSKQEVLMNQMAAKKAAELRAKYKAEKAAKEKAAQGKA